MNITCFIFAVVFLICAIMFLTGKGYLFIANWKKLSQEEKNEIPLKELSKNISILLFCCSILFFIAGFFSNFREHYFGIFMIIWLVAAGVDVYFIGKKKGR